MIGTFPSLLKLALLAGSAVLAVAIAAGFLGRFHPALDSFAHFRLHLAVLLAVVAVVLLALGLLREGLVGLLLAIGAFVVTPGTTPNLAINSPARAQSGGPDRPVYRLLQLNARYDNRTPEELVRLIASYRPDVVTLQEVSGQWRQRLETLRASYPHQLVCQVSKAIGGVAIISRRPFVDADQNACLDRGSLAIARIDFGGEVVNVASLHLGWPWPYSQARQVSRIAESLSQIGDAAVLAGDFNAVRWSETARSVERFSGMQQAAAAGPTWLSRRLPEFLRPVAGLGLDHALVGPAISAHGLKRGEFIGSDHLPLMLEFSITPKARDENATEIV